MVTTFDPGRMIWNGYTGAAGWMFRQALEGVLGLRLRSRRDGPPDRPGAGGRADASSASPRRDREPLAGPGGSATAARASSRRATNRRMDTIREDRRDESISSRGRIL